MMKILTKNSMINDENVRIGLAGFDNPMRDSKTEEVKRHIGQVRLF